MVAFITCIKPAQGSKQTSCLEEKGVAGSHPLLRSYWQIMVAREGRVTFLWRCGHWYAAHAPGDDPIPMCTWTALTELSKNKNK